MSRKAGHCSREGEDANCAIEDYRAMLPRLSSALLELHTQHVSFLPRSACYRAAADPKGWSMRTEVAIAVMGLICVGCTTQPASYASSLNHSDRKWQSAACREARQKAGGYEAEETERLKSSAMIGLLSPSSALATVNVTNQQNVRRKQFNRDLHLKCSSAPLPDELTNIPELQPPPMLNTERGS